MTKIPGEHKEFDKIPVADSKAIEKQGKIDGNMGMEISAEDLPAILNGFKVTLEKYQHSQITKAQKYFTECQKKITNGMAQHNIESIKINLSKITRNADKLNLDNEESELANLNQTFTSKKNNYDRFRKLNGRALLPVNADPSETKMQVIVVICLFFLETLLNVAMLQGGGATALSEAISVSLAQATYNIVSCYLLGKVLLGSLIHAEHFIKKLALALIFLGHTYTVAILNANMGIFRDTVVKNASMDVTMGEVALIGHWEWSPWDKITSIETTAVMVIGVGAVLALLAYIDGYKSDDPYPGYGAVYREALKIKNKIRSKLTSLSMKWNLTVREFNRSLGLVSSVANSSITEWSHEINTIEQISEDYKQLLEQVEKNFNNAVQLYVTTYNKFRSSDRGSITDLRLFSDNDRNMDIVFKDVKDFFMNDDERLEEEKQKKIIFSKEFDEARLELEKDISITSGRIKELQETYLCALN